MNHSRNLVSGLALVCALFAPQVASAVAEEPRLVPPGEVESVPFPGHGTELLLSAEDSPAGVAILEIEVPPRSFGAPPHVHSSEDEYFYVLEGTIQFLDRGETIEAREGSLMVLPRGHLHGFWNASDETARMLLTIAPGEFATFFDEVVAEIRRTAPKDARAVGALIGQAAAEHGVEIFPEKVPEAARAFLPR